MTNTIALAGSKVGDERRKQGASSMNKIDLWRLRAVLKYFNMNIAVRASIYGGWFVQKPQP